MEAFTVDTDQLGRRVAGQPGQLDVMRNGGNVIGIHMLDHTALGRTGVRISQKHVLQPVNGTETADKAPAHRQQYPEVEVMSRVITARISKITVVALGRRLDLGGISQWPRLCQQSQTTSSLHIFGAALTYQQGTLGIFLQIVGVLGNATDQDQRVALSIQTIGHHRAERKAGYHFRVS